MEVERAAEIVIIRVSLPPGSLPWEPPQVTR